MLTYESLREDFRQLLDPQSSLDLRLREVYRLKQTYLHTLPGVEVLLEAVDTTDSVLLQHEVVYNIGQSGCDAAVPGLVSILRNQRIHYHPSGAAAAAAADDDFAGYDTVTRHEAAEALGAIASPAAIEALRHYEQEDAEPEVAIRESCILALARIYMQEKKGKAALQPPADCPYVSVDPMPAFAAETMSAEELQRRQGAVPTTVEALTPILLNTDGGASLLERYMAMFTLRNIGTDAAVDALSRALREDTSSALFRHEVAFVLGQLERPRSQPALIAALRDEAEAAMVRHEAAEALGAIADEATLPVLREYATHPEPIVRDSCVVALEMHAYWSNFNSNANGAEQAEKEAAGGATKPTGNNHNLTRNENVVEAKAA
ncbi:deoxyhypusine monooxygenase [Strigomonas culicis]|nr:deoxyhypusine monooxygenase [Strigomonas culicis]EPY31073.1 deoxyhypusine monooxygenase [Strigomonas culicis]|eukprot:EPY27746.1 deoxyhypusine monooxygenase [Strigomonas culicis]